MEKCFGGASVQSKVDCGTWEDDPNPTWDWEKMDYRTTPALTYRSYETCAEFFQAMKWHGYYIHRTDINQYVLPTAVMQENNFSDVLIKINNNFEKVSILLNDIFEWADGTVCGIPK